MPTAPRLSVSSPAGFSLAEALIATTIMLIVTGGVTSALMGMTKSQTTIWNRTEMHSGVRSATELLQQEVGQAGRVTLPAAVMLAGTTLGDSTSQTVLVNSASGMFVGEYVTIGAGDTQETVQLTAFDAGGNTITGIFTQAHGVGEPVAVFGAFSSGIVPTTVTDGSGPSVLKLFGDINGDGNMVYVEYTCDTANHYLYRNVMAFDAASKPGVSVSQVLLNNVVDNPSNTACFTYQEQQVTAGFASPQVTLTYVTDVAITLTVQTQQKDPITNAFQNETKALLNVSPRNVLNIWQMASLNITNRIQPTPATVTHLMQ